MIPPPPRSPLFPYTTLFRSTSGCPLWPATTYASSHSTSFDSVTLGFFLDRKSTRLNSSHRTISYAVFCLKKKKKIGLGVNDRTSLFTCVASLNSCVLFTVVQ